MRAMGPMMGAAWNSFWYSDGSALNLAVARVLVAGQALWVVLSRDYGAISGLPSAFWAEVRPTYQWRFLDFPGTTNLEHALQWLAVGALVAALLGIQARWSCLLAGLLLYHLAPLESIIWESAPTARGLTIPVLALTTLGFAPCGDRLSIEPHRAAARGNVIPADYYWPLRLIQVFLCQVYLFSAYAKLERSGLGWVSGGNIQNWMGFMTKDPDFAVFQTPGLWIAAHPILCLAIAAAAFSLEAGFIWVLFSRRAAWWLVPIALAFHIGIVFTMNLTYLSAPLLLVFIDWERAMTPRHPASV
jgi:hypothetical protein